MHIRLYLIVLHNSSIGECSGAKAWQPNMGEHTFMQSFFSLLLLLNRGCSRLYPNGHPQRNLKATPLIGRDAATPASSTLHFVLQ